MLSASYCKCLVHEMGHVQINNGDCFCSWYRRMKRKIRNEIWRKWFWPGRKQISRRRLLNLFPILNSDRIGRSGETAEKLLKSNRVCIRKWFVILQSNELNWPWTPAIERACGWTRSWFCCRCWWSFVPWQLVHKTSSQWNWIHVEALKVNVAESLKRDSNSRNNARIHPVNNFWWGTKILWMRYVCHQ